MYSFATYDEFHGRFILKGAIPAQETLRAATTINPPFELSYCISAMNVLSSGVNVPVKSVIWNGMR